jgi:hypothetical protein
MAGTARSTVKSQRGKLARFSANKVFMSAKPSSKKIYMPPPSARVSVFPSGVVRAGSCLVNR